MTITALIENSTVNDELVAEHGLSLLIEFMGKKILFDTGVSGQFIDNAAKLGIDLSMVDYAMISHGHFDHAGGLFKFLAINDKAKVYMKPEAAGDYYAAIGKIIRRYIGVDKALFDRHAGCIHFVPGNIELMPGCHIVTEITAEPRYRNRNSNLYELQNNKLKRDSFKHELALALVEEGGITAITGCSHNGIINLVESIRTHLPGLPVKTVVGGFHLMSPLPNRMDCSMNFINEISTKLHEYGRVYACHCTGQKAFGLLKDRLGDKLAVINTGMTITV